MFAMFSFKKLKGVSSGSFTLHPSIYCIIILWNKPLLEGVSPLVSTLSKPCRLGQSLALGHVREYDRTINQNPCSHGLDPTSTKNVCKIQAFYSIDLSLIGLNYLMEF